MKSNKAKLQEMRIGCFLSKDFDFILKFYINEIKKLEAASHSPNFKKLIQTSKKAFYLQSFVEDVTFFGYPQITKRLEQGFLKEFGSKKILKKIQKDTLKRALAKLSGRHLIGENEYTVHKNKVYYRSLAGRWFQVSTSDVFYLLPKLDNMAREQDAKYLESKYKPNSLDKIYINWQQKKWLNKIDKSLIRIEDGETTPEKYNSDSVKQIKAILKNPVSLGALKNISKKDDEYLEQLIKVSYKIISFINRKRTHSTHLLHLLRDGIMFAEAQKTIDLLLHKNSPSSQIMISRKVLSSPEKEEYYWSLVVDVLYSALRKCSNSFDKFYEEYVTRMKEQENANPDLRAFFVKLSDYIKQSLNIKNDKTNRILICDTGLQGSINMLTKYLIDNYLYKNGERQVHTDIYLFIVGEWFKGVYKRKYFDDYYPMMKDIEIFMRSDQLYHYKQKSFETGKLKVVMGGKNQQVLANVELIVLVQMCVLMMENNLI